jgi:hypothetical protein
LSVMTDFFSLLMTATMERDANINTSGAYCKGWLCFGKRFEPILIRVSQFFAFRC